MNKGRSEKSSADHTRKSLRAVLREYSDNWKQGPALSWTEMYQAGEKLLEWKQEKSISGLWKKTPAMVTATLEDGIGQGLKMIHLFSRVAGIDVVPLGLMQKEDAIINACVKESPDFLGMTILQFDSEERLCHIVDRIPKRTKVIVGGPIFNMMNREDLSKKPYIVLNTVSAYLDFLLNLKPDMDHQLQKP